MARTCHEPEVLLQTVPRSPSPLKKDSRMVDALAAFHDSPQVSATWVSPIVELYMGGVCRPSGKSAEDISLVEQHAKSHVQADGILPW